MTKLMPVLLLLLLNGCTKPPDLEAPCRAFGKYCSQQPINNDAMVSTWPTFYPIGR